MNTNVDVFLDHVAFGEVAMAPPSLSAKPKKAPVKSQVATIITVTLPNYLSKCNA